ncbi:DsrE family protein [Algoriphagus aquimarinus]|uniref:DsrE family protein n=1 Tax=Algoriphagus aquimarinus TaxID=237018 RepID=UPI0030D9B696|tara:strand:+ start:2302 stop:3192 length:891 start_codon:yes stop_codon:yes gene_type:complete
MKKFLFLFTTCLIFSVSAQAQYFPFATEFKCSCVAEDSLAFLNAKEKLDNTLAALQKSGAVYHYGVSTDIEKSDEGDSTRFSVVFLELDEAAFQVNTQNWEESNPEILSFLTEKCATRTDKKMWDQAVSMPVIKSVPAMVLTIKEVDYKPDPSLKYKIVVDFTAFNQLKPEEKENYEIKPEEVNWGLGQLGRQHNLHVGAGIPKENITLVAAVHGIASKSFMTSEAYNNMYQMDNPNLDLLTKLHEAGVEFLLCGQSLGEIDRKDLLPFAKVTFTAQTTLSEFQMKGYGLKILEND